MKLEIANGSKRFGDHIALNDVSLKIESAQCLALIGPSGGGKSTLLRIIAGLEFADSGTVALDRQPLIFREPELREHRRRIGTVFQTLNLFPHLTALRNITLPLEKVHGKAPAEAEDTARMLLARFRLEAHASKRPGEMSGGQRQRVAIARALSIKPRLLLFDEPTSALDPEMTAEVLEMIEQLREEGRDLVIVTHQMGFARRVADHVAFLADGRVVRAEPAEAIFEDSSEPLIRAFLAKTLRY